MSRNKTILIVGGSGFIGTHLSLSLREGYKVFSTFHKSFTHIPGVTHVPLDVLNRDWIKRTLYTIEPDVIIYAVGNEDIGWCERHPRDADKLNTIGSVNVATISEILSPKFIYISNSMVFDGRRGNYKETDVIFPHTVLGKSKLGGENYLKGKSMNYLIIRSSPLYGRGSPKNHSFLDKMRILLDQGKKADLLNYELHSFAPIYGFVDLVKKLVECNLKNKIFHYGGLSKVSYYEFALTFAKVFGYDESLITPIETPAKETLREYAFFDYSMNSSELVNALKIQPFLLEEGLDLIKQQISIRRF